MPTEQTIQWTRRAEVALDRLQTRDQRRIFSILHRLEVGGLASKNISKLPARMTGGEIYLVRTGADLRIIVRRGESGIEILDIVRHDKLRQIINTFRRGGDAA